MCPRDACVRRISDHRGGVKWTVRAQLLVSSFRHISSDLGNVHAVLARIEEIQEDCLADDIDIDYELMKHWSEKRVCAFSRMVARTMEMMAAKQS